MVGEGVEAKYGFNDLANHWAEQEIIDLAKKNIINGYANGDFKPENKITRSEFVKIVTSAFNVENNNLEIPFKDVKGHWAEEYIAKAFGKNIINGYSKDEFGVNKNITREEAAKIISIVLEIKDTEEDKFIDKNEISNWALEHIDKTAKAKIINGYPSGEFKPKNNITRAESAVLIKKAMEFNK